MKSLSELPQQLNAMLAQATEVAGRYATSPPFYAQLAGIALAVLLAFLLAWIVRHRVPLLRDEPRPGAFIFLRTFIYRLRVLVFALLTILLLGVAAEVVQEAVAQNWLVKIAQSLAVVFLFYEIISRFIKQHGIKLLATWVGIPVATLHVFGWLDNVTAYLDTISLTAGNIRLSLFALLRTALFGAILFWLGRVSNTAGKQVIRRQQALDIGTREVFAKLFEIGLFIVIFLLLLQVMGINFTALAVFGGALGVGLGFGLQQIASNFISGIIILLDRSITIGDYIELEDGRAGTLRELNMRYGILETFDGKDIMVPNEQFITTSFTNWTHNNQKQRYSIELQVAYSTDLNRLFDMIREICADHPLVISGEQASIEELPDAEIAGFADSGIDVLVEFWMEGIDDGKNRVGADLMHAIWEGMQELGMEIPFPQREVRILGDSPAGGAAPRP